MGKEGKGIGKSYRVGDKNVYNLHDSVEAPPRREGAKTFCPALNPTTKCKFSCSIFSWVFERVSSNWVPVCSVSIK